MDQSLVLTVVLLLAIIVALIQRDIINGEGQNTIDSDKKVLYARLLKTALLIGTLYWVYTRAGPSLL